MALSRIGNSRIGRDFSRCFTIWQDGVGKRIHNSERGCLHRHIWDNILDRRICDGILLLVLNIDIFLLIHLSFYCGHFISRPFGTSTSQEKRLTPACSGYRGLVVSFDFSSSESRADVLSGSVNIKKWSKGFIRIVDGWRILRLYGSYL